LELIAKLVLQGNEIILDIGCGDGKITAEIANHVPNGLVLGIDSSQEMIGFAQTKFPTNNFPNLAFQYGDAAKLNFHNEFDVIASFACLHWISDHIAVLEGIKKSLKPSGKALLQFGGKGNAATIKDVIEQVIYSDKWRFFFQDFTFKTHFYGADEYKDLLDRVGLRARRIDLITKDAIHQGKEGLKGWIRTTGIPNYIGRVPENLHQQIIDEIVDTYVEIYPVDSEGLVHVPMMRLEVEATKL
jgi:trans-aconitate methyltransferase